MASPWLYDWSAVVAGAEYRLAEFGAAWLQYRAAGADPAVWREKALDLALKRDQAQAEPDPVRRDALVGYLCETYGLLALPLDAWAQAVPPLPATGGTVRVRVRGFNGKAALFNSNTLIAVGAVVVPAS